MPFIKKTELLAAAEALGVNLDGLSWPEQQKVVQEAIAKHEKSFSSETDGWSATAYGISSKAPKPKPQAPTQKKTIEQMAREHAKTMAKAMEHAKPVIISEEIKPTPTQLIKYHEEVGDEVASIQDVSYLNGMPDMSGGNASATYIVRGKTGRKQLALSTIPHQNAQIIYDPNGPHWLAPIVKDFDGREGYLFNHHAFGGIKPLLIKSGYWEEYKARFNAVNFPQNIWMAGGKFYACDINLCETIFKEIERKAADEKRQRNTR